MSFIQENVDLKNYTSLRAGGKAGTLIELESTDSLAEVVSQYQTKKPIWLLGFGTNCLISDKGLSGTVIINQKGKIELLGDSKIHADSGANWDELVQVAIANNLWGVEFMSEIPGGVGAAIAGNIAAYGHKVADSFIEASILNTNDGSVEIWDKSRLSFNYRTSALQLPENKSFIVLDATFRLSTQPNSQLEYESALKVARELKLQPDSLANRRKIIIETRRQAGALLNDMSAGPWTAGSFFKNPLVNETQAELIIANEEVVGKTKEQILRQNLIHGQDRTRVSAALVLLAAGFKRGQSWGNVRLNSEHILKIENTGGATAQQIYDVVQNIIKTTQEKLGITLESEVRFLGEF